MKPAETGCTEIGGVLEPADARGLATVAACALSLELICPYRYRARLAPALAAEADGTSPPDVDRIADCFREIAAASDVTLVEDQGGVAAPVTSQVDYAELASRLKLRPLIVVRNDRSAASMASLTFRYVEQKRLAAAGFLLNQVEPVEPSFEPELEWWQRAAGAIPCLGYLRHKEPLAIAVVERLLAESGARI